MLGGDAITDGLRRVGARDACGDRRVRHGAERAPAKRRRKAKAKVAKAKARK